MSRNFVAFITLWLLSTNVLIASCDGNRKSESDESTSYVNGYSEKERDIGNVTKKNESFEPAVDSVSPQHKRQGVIKISEPVVVYEAEKVEKWGFVQFPRILENEKGEICVTWNMADDNI